jgi:hypothetical protein
MNRWWAWLLLGVAVGGWIGYELGRPSWLRAAQSIAGGQRAPGIVEAVAVAASGLGNRWEDWRFTALQTQAMQCAADLVVAQTAEGELRARLGRMADRTAQLQRAAEAASAAHTLGVIDAVSERATLYAGECRDWGLQPVCAGVQRLRQLEHAQLPGTGGAPGGGADIGAGPVRADRSAADAGGVPGFDQRRAGDVRAAAGAAADPRQPGPRGAAGTAGVVW